MVSVKNSVRSPMKGEKTSVNATRKTPSMSLEGEDHLLSDIGEAASGPLYREESTACSGNLQPEWFAAYTMSRQEKRIASHCERIGIRPLSLVRTGAFCHERFHESHAARL